MATSSQEVLVAQALKAMQDEMKMPRYSDALRLNAMHQFARFQAFEKAGFDERQALELVIRKAG